MTSALASVLALNPTLSGSSVKAPAAVSIPLSIQAIANAKNCCKVMVYLENNRDCKQPRSLEKQ